MKRNGFWLALVLIGCGAVHAQWQILNSNTTADLRGIDNVGGGVAWASGTNGTVLRTEDGGYLWQTCTVPPGAEKLDFRGIQAFDANTAIVMSSGTGDLSRLYKTTDGCQTWKLLFTNPDKDGFFDSVYFPREQRLRGEHEGFGLLLGDPVGGEFAIFEARDDGLSWKRISDYSLKVAGAEYAAFAASNSCISGFGGATFDIIVGGTAGSFLFRISYKGHYWLDDASPLERTWQRESVPMVKGVDSAGAFSVGERVQFPANNPAPDFSDLRLHEVIVGGNYRRPDDTAGTAAFSQTGRTWSSAQTPPHGYRSAVAYYSAAKTWITVGPNGTDVSVDDGRNWKAVHPDVSLHEAADADRNWNALSLPYVVGPKGRIGKLDRSSF
jgi:photosystem II stability/assembly factor-like uncharacterized protein